jgi:hypothetical protein
MSDFQSMIGVLTLDIGSGWLSRFEAGSLGAGDVVRSEAEAGKAYRVELNGGYFCDASLAESEGRLFARVERLEPETPAAPFPERGDDATEMLGFAIRMSSAGFRLGELAGIGRYSFLDLGGAEGGAALEAGEDALLVVAGIALAAGKVAVAGERMCLRITRRLLPPFEEAEIRTSGALLPPGYDAEPVKDYDFSRPDAFTKRCVDRAGAVHAEFARILGSRLPGIRFRLTLVDQLSYAEWTEERSPRGGRYALLRTTPDRPREGGAALPAKLLARPTGAGAPPGDPTLARLRGRAEDSARAIRARPVIAALEGEALGLLREDPALAIAASCLRGSWKRVADLRLEAKEAPVDGIPGDEAAYPGEMILLARLEAEGGGGRLDLVYPMRTLEAFRRALDA